MEGYDGARRGGLSQRHVGDGAAAAKDADSSLTPAGELGHAFGDVVAAGHLHHVTSEGVWAVARDENRGFGLVFGSRRAASRSASADFYCTLGGLVAVVFLFFIVSFAVVIAD